MEREREKQREGETGRKIEAIEIAANLAPATISMERNELAAFIHKERPNLGGTARDQKKSLETLDFNF